MQPWQIWIDTGGTFTDCLGRDPSGTLHRAKVLSTGALRGRIARRVDARRLVIEQNWKPPPCDDLIAGFTLRLLEGEARPALPAAPLRVRSFRAHNSVIELEAPAPAELAAGAMCEVAGDEPAAILAARLITGTPAGAALPPMAMRFATTRGTNALLERRGAPTALFITEGFGDLLRIGDQARPDIFALNIQKPAPLFDAVVEVRERLNADGEILRPLDFEHLTNEARRLAEQGIRAAAIALIHSYRNPAHEQAVAAALDSAGFEHVSQSTQLAPLIRILPRAQTAVVDAYLAAILRSHLAAIGDRLAAREAPGTRHQALDISHQPPVPSARCLMPPPSSLHVMTSAGGLVRAAEYRAFESLLSGPAGGVVGAAAAGRESGFTRVIGFDMGGTSTDAARFDGDFEYRFEHTVRDARLLAPALAIETVAAGGGSICDFIDGRLQVGPHSAGADPGPACYGMGGPLTLTDVNLLLGRLDPQRFEIPLAIEPARRAFESLLDRIGVETGTRPQPDVLLEGLLAIADARMAAAIEQVSVRQGYDPRDYALVAFGGAGGQHACAVAARLEIETVIMPADASLLSAKGLGAAVVERFAQRQVLATLDRCADRLTVELDRLAQDAIEAVVQEGEDRADVLARRRIASARLLGQDTSLPIELEPGDRGAALVEAIRRGFVERYRATYGHEPPLDKKPIEIESLRVIASTTAFEGSGVSGQVSGKEKLARNASKTPRTASDARRRVRMGGAWIAVPVYDRARLVPGAAIDGPALIFDRRSTCVIEPGWRCELDGARAIIAQRAVVAGSNMPIAGTRDPKPESQHDLVRLELLTNRLMSIATDMGHMLQRTALSTNVKERLDFSCAVLDAEGELIVNAPHIPVHLGAIGVCVRAVREAIEMAPGDVIITNHPAFGGSHLPDITVITPVFEREDAHAGGELIGYVASRAHHAEIGGIRPGSMPPNATRLIEEGVIIPPTHLVRQGREQFDQIEAHLLKGPHPTRAVADNLADLCAAVAANHRGAVAMRGLAAEIGAPELRRFMDAMKARAGHLASHALTAIPAGRYEATERLDDGAPIDVSIEIGAGAPTAYSPLPTALSGRAIIDFAGSAPQHAGNLNATPAIVRSAVIYVLRLLVGRAIPLNEGLMRAVDLRIPCGMLNPDFSVPIETAPAVVGGNVETSQRVVDTLLKALHLSACSQGTMNNVLFGTAAPHGSASRQYYETVCGGSGAGPDWPGCDAVHTHMTNTRITDVEIIEQRYPVRVERFAIRRGSGGAGRFRGGDGAVRELTFLQPMSLSILAQHRVEAPYGMEGGQPGVRGRQRLVRSGETIELKPIDGAEVHPGDRLILETPGGGGWGPTAS